MPPLFPLLSRCPRELAGKQLEDPIHLRSNPLVLDLLPLFESLNLWKDATQFSGPRKVVARSRLGSGRLDIGRK